MTYSINILKSAQKSLEKIPDPDFSRIVKLIKKLSLTQRPSGCKKLSGRPAYRIRSGNYRVIYETHDDIKEILIVAIGHRKNIY